MLNFTRIRYYTVIILHSRNYFSQNNIVIKKKLLFTSRKQLYLYNLLIFYINICDYS